MSNPTIHPLSDLEPRDVFSFFYDMSQIPRPSGKNVPSPTIWFRLPENMIWNGTGMPPIT